MSKETPTPDQICGNCMWFRTKTVGGQPIGTIEVEPGKEVKKGVCTAWPAGLLIPGLDEATRCRQKPGIFAPSEDGSWKIQE